MKKVFVVCVAILIFIVSCSDNSDEIWDCDPTNECGGIGELTCKSDSSYVCDAGCFFYYTLYETCNAGCDTQTGRCKPWKDPDSGLMWSHLENNDSIENLFSWDESVSYCENLSLAGYNDWHLPTIDELRTLVQNSPGIEAGGTCKVSETNGCLSSDCWTEDCRSYDSSGYCKLNSVWSWSSSTLSDDSESVWFLSDYNYLSIYADKKAKYGFAVRCVRKAE